MAATQESYRLQGRNPRYTTRLNSFANGMYLTNQTVPEGYAKYMLNYDIDDTGSHIKPKRGRKKVQDVEYKQLGLAGVSLSDYIYCYDESKDNVITTEDLVLSFGRFIRLNDYLQEDAMLPMYFAGKASKTTNTTSYAMIENEQGDLVREVIEEGAVTTVNLNEFWALRYDNNNEVFVPITNINIDSIAAHSIIHAYAFDKRFKEAVGRPIYTVLENEIYTLTGGPTDVTLYPNNPEYNEAIGQTPSTLSKLILSKKDESDDYSIEYKPVTGKTINPVEAYTSGFNLLLAEEGLMYRFENNQTGAPSILGVIPYTNKTDYIPEFYPVVGNEITVGVWYAYTGASTQVQFKLEIRNGDAAYDSSEGWELIQDWGTNITPSKTEAAFFTFNAKYANTMYRIQIRNKDDDTTVSSTVRLLYAFNTDLSTIDATITPDIGTAKGMVTWQSCLGLYGFANARNMLIFSAVEEPDYFPFPDNVIVFDNEILAVHNYLDNLIVITVDSIFLLTVGTSIATSIQKRILANIHIPEIDAVNLVVLKDQIFFKTDTQFYVLKPNTYTSDATDLKNYVNSTAMANYLNNFTEETVRLLNKDFIMICQKYSKELKQDIKFLDFDVHDTWSIIRDNEVHYIYNITPKLGYVIDRLFKQEDVTLVRDILSGKVELTPEYLMLYDLNRDGYIKEDDLITITDMADTGKHVSLNRIIKEDEMLNLHFVYNTMTRAWRLYFSPVGTQETSFIPILYRNKQSGSFYEFFPHDYDGDSTISIIEQSYDLVDDNIVDVDGWNLVTDFNNYPYIETGTIVADDLFTKRFREVQLNLINLEKTKIRFYTNFVLDGQDRVDATRYLVEHITDVNDPDYGRVWVTPMEATNLDLVGLTTLANTELETDFWEVDLSHFPDLTVLSVRFELQGRGRRGNLQLLNTSLKRYELSDINWVYRMMNAR